MKVIKIFLFLLSSVNFIKSYYRLLQTRHGEAVEIHIEIDKRYEPYLRWDVKFGYRVNSKKKNVSQQFFMDFQNVTGKQNIFSRRFNTRTNDINDVYQSGFFPDIMYRMQF